MKEKPVLFIDSGIGGIPYCRDFLKNNQQESVFYLADKKNFPYGPRDKEEIASILVSLMEEFLKKTEPKITVLACNTATISAINALRENFPQIPFVGTVPALKPAAISCGNGKVGILATERTIEELDSLDLTDKYCEITGIAAPELVEFVEKKFDAANGSEKKEIVKKYINKFRGENVNTLVLGCTHFLYLLEEFQNEASPSIIVFDSIAGITKRIEYLLDKNNLRAGKNSKAEYKFLLTGSKMEDPLWRARALKMGFELFYFDEP
ncbi:MAG: glutamate racemase [Treponema sp.]|nr:glutamate racemase [Treponema sp.]MCL2271412.1 glutamate racemase [Treponema sp.]